MDKDGAIFLLDTHAADLNAYTNIPPLPSHLSQRRAMQTRPPPAMGAFLILLLRPHVHNLQRRIHQLNNMPGLHRLGVNILHVMRVEDARLGAVQNGLFARRIREAEAAPTTHASSAQASLNSARKGQVRERT